MHALSFEFDVAAVILDGTAHRASCPLLPRPLGSTAIELSAGASYRAERCPAECPRCRPAFQTLLGRQRPLTPV